MLYTIFLVGNSGGSYLLFYYYLIYYYYYYLFIRLKYSPLFQAGLILHLKSFKALNSLVKIATHMKW